MRKAAHFEKTSAFLTAQEVFHILVLIGISLLLVLIPSRSYGQTAESSEGEAFPAFDAALAFDAAVTGSGTTEPAPTADVPPTPIPVAPTAPPPPTLSRSLSERTTLQPPAAVPVNDLYSPPAPAAATVQPVTANQFQTLRTTPQSQSRLQAPPQNLANADLRNVEHPFRRYWGVPNDPQTTITGQSMTVNELFTGTQSSSARCRLLQAYWELSGKLALYHFRAETERFASSSTDGRQADLMTLLREQRRTAEAEFVKQQYVLTELLKQYKGQVLSPSELPIPSDFPLYPRYQTHADQLARTKRTQYLGRMIPIQEQIIETKYSTWKAASEMLPSAAQPFFVISDQRSSAFLELTSAMVEYNKMIAEYALETIPPNVSQEQLVGAVVRFPAESSRPSVPAQPQSFQRPAEGVSLTGYTVR